MFLALYRLLSPFLWAGLHLLIFSRVRAARRGLHVARALPGFTASCGFWSRSGEAARGPEAHLLGFRRAGQTGGRTDLSLKFLFFVLPPCFFVPLVGVSVLDEEVADQPRILGKDIGLGHMVHFEPLASRCLEDARTRLAEVEPW